MPTTKHRHSSATRQWQLAATPSNRHLHGFQRLPGAHAGALIEPGVRPFIGQTLDAAGVAITDHQLQRQMT